MDGPAHLDLVLDKHFLFPLLRGHGSQDLFAESPASQVGVGDDPLRGNGAEVDLTGLVAVPLHEDAAGILVHNGRHPPGALPVVVNGLVVLHAALLLHKQVVQEAVFPGLLLNRRQLCPGRINIHIKISFPT